MSPVSTKAYDHFISFPRVSGDEPIGRDSADDALAFSPRERG